MHVPKPCRWGSAHGGSTMSMSNTVGAPRRKTRTTIADLFAAERQPDLHPRGSSWIVISTHRAYSYLNIPCSILKLKSIGGNESIHPAPSCQSLSTGPEIVGLCHTDQRKASMKNL